MYLLCIVFVVNHLFFFLTLWDDLNFFPLSGTRVPRRPIHTITTRLKGVQKYSPKDNNKTSNNPSTTFEAEKNLEKKIEILNFSIMFVFLSIRRNLNSRRHNKTCLPDQSCNFLAYMQGYLKTVAVFDPVAQLSFFHNHPLI